MPNNRTIRIKDIARLAGVSAGTVDRVLHNRGRVSQEALDKINAVMDQIDYRPNLIARTLGSNKKYKIAVLIPDPTSDPYWKITHSGISDAIQEWQQYGIEIELFPYNHLDKQSFITAANQLVAANPDGIVAAPVFYQEALQAFRPIQELNIPCILFNTFVPEVSALGFIGQNHFQSGMVAAALVRAHHPKPGTLAIVHIDEDYLDSIHLLEKEKGFRNYFEKHRLTGYTIIDFTLNPTDPGFTTEFQHLLNQEDLRGIFVSTSQGTTVVAENLLKHGKGEIRLVGYDLLQHNIEFLRTGIIDFLIHQNPKRQATVSINTLVNHLMFNKQVPAMELFPLEIITPENLDSYLMHESPDLIELKN